MPTRYEAVAAVARLVPQLSSRFPLVVPPAAFAEGAAGDALAYQAGVPPISSDPPEHGPARRLILPAFSPHAVAGHEPFTRTLAHELVDAFAGRGRCDAAAGYAQQIPPRAIA